MSPAALLGQAGYAIIGRRQPPHLLKSQTGKQTGRQPTRSGLNIDNASSLALKTESRKRNREAGIGATSVERVLPGRVSKGAKREAMPEVRAGRAGAGRAAGLGEARPTPAGVLLRFA